MSTATKPSPNGPNVHMQMSLPQLIMHIMKGAPQLYQEKTTKQYLKIAKRKYKKTGKRGTFCLVFGSLQDAYEYKPVQHMIWRPCDHEMVRDFSDPPLTQISTYDVDRAYHVLIVVSKKDGLAWKRREMVFSAPPETLVELAKEEAEEAKHEGDRSRDNDRDTGNTTTSDNGSAPKLSKTARKNAKRRAKLKAQKQNQQQNQ